jgi:hypothetical protein
MRPPPHETTTVDASSHITSSKPLYSTSSIILTIFKLINQLVTVSPSCDDTVEFYLLEGLRALHAPFKLQCVADEEDDRISRARCHDASYRLRHFLFNLDDPLLRLRLFLQFVYKEILLVPLPDLPASLTLPPSSTYFINRPPANATVNAPSSSSPTPTNTSPSRHRTLLNSNVVSLSQLTPSQHQIDAIKVGSMTEIKKSAVLRRKELDAALALFTKRVIISYHASAFFYKVYVLTMNQCE